MCVCVLCSQKNHSKALRGREKYKWRECAKMVAVNKQERAGRKERLRVWLTHQKNSVVVGKTGWVCSCGSPKYMRLEKTRFDRWLEHWLSAQQPST